MDYFTAHLSCRTYVFLKPLAANFPTSRSMHIVDVPYPSLIFTVYQYTEQYYQSFVPLHSRSRRVRPYHTWLSSFTRGGASGTRRTLTLETSARKLGWWRKWLTVWSSSMTTSLRRMLKERSIRCEHLSAERWGRFMKARCMPLPLKTCINPQYGGWRASASSGRNSKKGWRLTAKFWSSSCL